MSRGKLSTKGAWGVSIMERPLNQPEDLTCCEFWKLFYSSQGNDAWRQNCRVIDLNISRYNQPSELGFFITVHESICRPSRNLNDDSKAGLMLHLLAEGIPTKNSGPQVQRWENTHKLAWQEMELHLLLPGTVLGCIRDIVLITIPKVPCACLDRITRDLVSFPVAENWALGVGQSLGKHPTAGALELWWLIRWWKKTGSMALMEIHFRKVNILRICWFLKHPNISFAKPEAYSRCWRRSHPHGLWGVLRLLWGKRLYCFSCSTRFGMMILNDYRIYSSHGLKPSRKRKTSLMDFQNDSPWNVLGSS